MKEAYITREELWRRLDAVRTALGVSFAEPSDPFQLAALTGCRVGLHAFEGNIGGMLMYLPDGPAVLLNSARPRQSRRFSLAHELTHLWLHPVRANGQAYNRSCEWQANAGASELLVPHRALLRLIRDGAFLSSAELECAAATRFDVSRTIARLALAQAQTYMDPAPADKNLVCRRSPIGLRV